MMTTVLALVVTALGGAPAPAFDPALPARKDVLATLQAGHPRLLAGADTFPAIARLARDDPLAGAWYAAIRKEAEALLAKEPSRYEIPDGLRLLATSRRVVDRVYTLALAYRIEKDARYAQRAFKELAAAAAFPDWNPRHFLDTAEMTHAFAIGYDWMYDALTGEQRGVIRGAIVEKGLTPALAVYRREPRAGGWHRVRHNWNQVCNGGIAAGALALADEIPDTAAEIIEHALASFVLPSREFAPDGAWAEGPGYWRYATQYHVLFLAALTSALGTDFGLSDAPGLAETGTFPLYMTGPSGQTFNFADAGAGAIRAPQMFWFARRFQAPVYAWYAREHARPEVLDLVWFDARGDAASAAALPPARHYRNAEVATLRSAWNDPNALFVAFKAGDNKANHSNLDIGTFVLEALGQRWAIDLGADDYNLPAYFGAQRWTYYRLRAEGHNTLVINPGRKPDQDPRAATAITRFAAAPGRSFAIADLTAAYKEWATSVARGVALVENRAVIVQDEIELPAPGDIRWFMHTRAEIAPAPGGATLSLGGAALAVKILEPAGAAFTVMDAVPLPESPKPERQNENKGVRKLALTLPGAARGRIAVAFIPLRGDKAAPPPPVTPLSAW
ncbi:MAG TPA: coagulation factor 5/8 type domain-containing protein [Planctomycetes bacterium]|nr:coagulation factor 5/8 type domain-containing protein [Planctomycetota bacterium]